MEIKVPDFHQATITTKPDSYSLSEKAPTLLPLATATKPNTKEVSSGLVVKVPDFLPIETH